MVGTATRPDDLRRQNRSAVLQAVRENGALSRTDISSRAGLSPATVSAISTALLGAGILREADGKGPVPQRRGRPQVLLEPDPQAALVGALALTLKGLRIELVDYAGSTLGSGFLDLQTLDMTAGELIDRISAELRLLIARHSDGDAPLRHITMAIQGVTNSDMGRMLWSPILRERDVDFRTALSQAFGVPVIVDNDCNLIAEALCWSQDFPFSDGFAAILLGHGIGMGLYLHGVRFHGTVSSAGEFGHMLFMPRGRLCRCGAQGCIEAYAGDYAIIGAALPEDREPALRGDVPADAFARVIDKARAGDAGSVDAFRMAGEALGSGLANIFSIFDPLPVALVGEGAAAFDLMEDAIHDVLGTTAMRNVHGDVAIRCFPNEQRLILEGCSMTSLRQLDSDIFAQTRMVEPVMEPQP